MKNLAEGGNEKCPSICKFIDEEHGGDQHKLGLLLRKGVFPFDSVNSLDDLAKGLPYREEFHNKLTDTACSDADWQHVNEVWQAFDCQILGDLCNIYCKSDVMLLVDVVNNYREQTKKMYGLEALHFCSAPGQFKQGFIFKKLVLFVSVINANLICHCFSLFAVK